MVVIQHIDGLRLPGGRDPLPGGFLGVDVFFVLSGFLITRLLLDEREHTGRLSLGRFYGRRAARLLPALGLFLVGHVIWVSWARVGVSRSVELESLLVIGLYVSNWAYQLGVDVAYGLGHLWSLAVEEQFYVVWPFLVWWLRRRIGLLWVVIAVGVVVAIGVRNHLWDQGTYWMLVYIRTDSRMDSLLMGCALALIHHRGLVELVPARIRQAGALAGGAVIVAAAVLVQPANGMLYRVGFTVLALGTALLIAGVVGPEWWLSRWLGASLPRLVGRVSYGLYLWHPMMLYGVDHALPEVPRAASVVLALALTGLVVGLSWTYLERPVLAWSHRRFARPGSTPTTTVDARILG